MMATCRIVRLIESHAEALASGLERENARKYAGQPFARLAAHDLSERVYEICRHLGERLLGKNEPDFEHRDREIGALRAARDVPLSQVIEAIVLTKENLWDFLKSDAVMDRGLEIMGKQELSQMLEMFFDRAIYYGAVGYEEEVARVLRESERAR